MKLLWNSDLIKEWYRKRMDSGIVDSTPYFMDDLDRIVADDYKPTREDNILMRVPTTGARKISLKVNDTLFDVFEYGGHRSERNKWIHSFSGVNAVIYIASLIDYDQTLYEESQINAMKESIVLLHLLTHYRCFRLTTFILVFTKYDIFKEKIKSKSIKSCFNEFNDDSNDCDKSVQYIVNQYKTVLPQNKKAFIHIANIANKTEVQKIFDNYVPNKNTYDPNKLI